MSLINKKIQMKWAYVLLIPKKAQRWAHNIIMDFPHQASSQAFSMFAEITFFSTRLFGIRFFFQSTGQKKEEKKRKKQFPVMVWGFQRAKKKRNFEQNFSHWPLKSHWEIEVIFFGNLKITISKSHTMGQPNGIWSWGVSSVPFPFWFPFQLHCEPVQESVHNKFKIFWYGVLPKTRDLF